MTLVNCLLIWVSGILVGVSAGTKKFRVKNNEYEVKSLFVLLWFILLITQLIIIAKG